MNNYEYLKGFHKGIQRSTTRSLLKNKFQIKLYELGQKNIIKLDKFFNSHSCDYYIGYYAGLNNK